MFVFPLSPRTPKDLFSAFTLLQVIAEVHCECMYMYVFKHKYVRVCKSKINHKMCEEVMTQQAIYEPRSYVNLSILFQMEKLSFLIKLLLTTMLQLLPKAYEGRTRV